MFHRRTVCSGKLWQENRLDTTPNFECLESRRLLAGHPVITEFMARNSGSLQDREERSEDWIEIQNQGDQPIDLVDYRLTDRQDDLSRWSFPSVTLDIGEYLVVFASGRATDEGVDAAGHLHTNFRLAADGDYLALVSPEGLIVSEFGVDGTNYPRQIRDVSYGVATTETVGLVEAGSLAEYVVPLDGPPGTTWTELEFDAAAAGFLSGFAAVGYETRPTTRTSFSDEILTPIPADSHAVFVRVPFYLEDVSQLQTLTLGMKYDNGFVAYLNGVKVAQANAPDDASFETVLETRGTRDSNSLQYVDFDLSTSSGMLVDGRNVLAIHGLNYVRGDRSDMLASPRLQAVISGQPLATGYFVKPTPGAINIDAAAGLVDFSRRGAILTEAAVVELSTPSPTATIRYTTDGSDPTTASPSYSGPITVETSQPLRARAFEDGLRPGPVAQESFIALADDIRDFNTNLPIVVVDTFDVTIPGGDSEPGSSFSVIIQPDEVTGRAHITAAHDFAGKVGLRVRGRSSASFPKRQYKFEIQDENGNDLDASLLGMPSESDWVLHAPYTDKSLMRNFFSYRLWESLGYWSPRTQFVEVFLNTDGDERVSYEDDYVGVYVLMEGIKAGEDRVDIQSPEDPTRGEQVTGGFLIETGNADSANDFTTRGSGRSMAHYFHDPRREELSEVQRDWMQTYLEEFESALYAASFTDPVTGKHYSDYIDLDAFVDFEIMRQFLKNFDGGSTYYSLGRGGKLQMGPLWDYNWALGNVHYAEGNDIPGYRTDGWNLSWTADLNGWPAWWRRLDQDVDYWQRFIDRWSELRTSRLHEDVFLTQIDTLADRLAAESVDRNFSRWQILGKFTNISPPGYKERDTYQKEVDYLKDWLVARAAWIDSRFVTAPIYQVVSQDSRSSVALDETVEGSIYYTVDGTDPRLPGGKIAANAVVYDGPVTLKEGEVLMARLRVDGDRTQPVTVDVNGRQDLSDNGKFDGSPWSPPVYVELPAPASPADGLRITEINYHPATPTIQEVAAGFDDADDFEFIELTNVGAETIDLVTARFDRVDVEGEGYGVEFDFSSSGVRRIESGQSIVVVEDVAAFRYRYGNDIRVAGEWRGGLGNGGETIRLVDHETVIHQFAYNDRWHPETDGGGLTLEIIDASANDLRRWTQGDAWRSSNRVGGTPGVSYVPGDANRDGVFNSQDLDLVFAAGEYEDDIPHNSTFGEGDWNGDGDFTSEDIVLAFIAGHYQTEG